MKQRVYPDEILATGQAGPPSPWRRLCAGPLEILLDGVELRSITYRGVQVVQQVYVAVRDSDWNTLGGSIEGFDVVEGPGRCFVATFRSRHDHLGMDFDWHGRISGGLDGVIEYSLVGGTSSGLSYTRVGFNAVCGVEHFRGRPYRAALDGKQIEGRLPDLVGPQAIENGRETGLFAPFRHLELSPADDVWVEFDLSGDEFEMEDQRNFGDGSYKIYSTPLQRPSPFSLAPGQVFEQSMRIRVADHRRSVKSLVGAPSQTVKVGAATERRLPNIGMAHANDGGPLHAREVALLARLRPDHIWLELDAAAGVDEAMRRLAGAASDARRLGCDLRIEIRDALAANPSFELYIAKILATGPEPSHVLLRGSSMVSLDTGPFGQALAATRALVERSGARSSVGVTTDFLADLICRSFDAGFIRVASFGLCPTVHRSDDASIMENLVGIESEVATARAALGDGELLVGPITLATRYGPYPDGPVRPDGLPPSIDRRQAALIGAAWTLGCLSALGRSGVESATFYETWGPRGSVEGASAPPALGASPDGSRRVYPLWHVMADAAELRGSRLRALDIDVPGVVGVAALTKTGTELLLASTLRETLRFSVTGLADGRARVRTLDATSASVAMHEPDEFRQSGFSVDPSRGRLPLTLGPYAMVRVQAGG